MVGESVNTGGLTKFVYRKGEKFNRKSKPKENLFSFKIHLRTLFLRPVRGVNVELKKIDFDFFDDFKMAKSLKSSKFESKTSKEGVASFPKVEEGFYLAKFTKSVFFEKIIRVEPNLVKKIYAPFFFPFIVFGGEIEKKKISEILGKVRSDLKYCAICDKGYVNLTDRFSCRYCGRYFCSDHRIPEDHKCGGFMK